MRKTLIDKYVSIARDVAVKSDGTHQHAAILIDRRTNRILAISYNKTSILPRMKIRGVHAEVGAIMQCSRKDLKGAIMIVIRIDPVNHDTFKSSQPCITCQHVIERYGINKVYHT